MTELLEKYKNFLLARQLSLNYYNRIRVFLSWCEKNKIDYNNLCQDIITDFFNSQKYSSQSVNASINAGRNFYTDFLGNNENEWQRIQLVKTEQKRPEFLTEEEIKKVIKLLSINNQNLLSPLKSDGLLTFLLYTGLRKGEILNLYRKDFNLDNKSVIIRVPNKGKKERIIFYPKEVKEKLEKYFSSEPEVENAFNLSLAKINYIAKIIGQYSGKHFSCRSFRHSCGRFLMDKIKNPYIVKDQLGHENIKTTMIYSLPDEKMRKHSIEETFEGEIK